MALFTAHGVYARNGVDGNTGQENVPNIRAKKCRTEK